MWIFLKPPNKQNLLLEFSTVDYFNGSIFTVLLLFTVVVHAVKRDPSIGNGNEEEKLSVESSCRKYFDALAKTLALFYKFKWGADDENTYPSFGDVLFAYKNNHWSHIIRYKSTAERADETGFTQVAGAVPRIGIDLPKLFEEAEWKKLKEWNQKTNDRIHDATLPTTKSGKYFIILPRSDDIEDTIKFFKTIGCKGKLFQSESDLEVKVEGELSESSNSVPTATKVDNSADQHTLSQALSKLFAL